MIAGLIVLLFLLSPFNSDNFTTENINLKKQSIRKNGEERNYCNTNTVKSCVLRPLQWETTCHIGPL